MDTRMAAGARRCAGWCFGRFKWLIVAFVMVFVWPGGHACAAVLDSPRVTLIVFSDQRMSEAQWNALSGQLQEDVTRTALETHLVPPALEIVRGSKAAPGFHVEEPVSVYLHGECSLVPHPSRYVVQGALGWVLRDHGHIGPFIHVDCSRIAEMVGQHALGMNQERRDTAMAEAISRVVMHEMIHIATQSATHTSEGVEKGAFNISDLIGNRRSYGMHAAAGK